MRNERGTAKHSTSIFFCLERWLIVDGEQRMLCGQKREGTFYGILVGVLFWSNFWERPHGLMGNFFSPGLKKNAEGFWLAEREKPLRVMTMKREGRNAFCVCHTQCIKKNVPLSSDTPHLAAIRKASY